MKFDYQNMKKRAERLYRDKPGQRFKNYHKRRGVKNEEVWKSAAYVMLGLFLIVGGGIIGIAPGIPAVLFVLIGLILIVSRLRFAATLLDWGEVRLRYFFHQLFKGRP